MSKLRLIELDRQDMRNPVEDAYLGFRLTRQTKLCTKATQRFYRFTAGKFVEWLIANDLKSPHEIESHHIRACLAELSDRDLSDSYIHSHARAIRTFVSFLCDEEYIARPIKFQMPSIRKKRLSVLPEVDVKAVLRSCNSKRVKALTLLLVDSGLKRAEVCALNWGDVDIESGVIRVERGKRGKARSVVVGVTTRRALLAYRR